MENSNQNLLNLINDEYKNAFKEQITNSIILAMNQEELRNSIRNAGFSIVDVVKVLSESADGRKYWNKLKQRLKAEGNESVTNCHQLKLPSSDGNCIVLMF